MPVLGWLLNAAYALLLTGLSPAIAWRMWFRAKYREGWGEKLWGRLPERAPRLLPSSRGAAPPRVWFHAVSVGEVLQLRSIVAGLRERLEEVDVVISTTTSTGHAVARERFPDCTVCYFPLDFTWSVGNAIRRVRPTAIVLVELELWPNFVFAARRAGVPLLLVNGRLSENSFRNYARVRPLMRRLLNAFHTIAVQSETYAERFRQLGAEADRVAVTGSVKFDHLEANRDNARTRELRATFGIGTDESVFVAGSTQAPEERLALETYRRLRAEFPRLRLVLVPRHAERFEEVARLVTESGFGLVRRSRAEHREADPRPPVLLLDTLGELGACWGLADVAFVGGSLVPHRGGQNMMEPAAYGAAVTFGPHTRNFRDVVEMLVGGSAARVVRDGEELTDTVRDLLAKADLRRDLGRRARELVLAQRGATERTLQAILSALPRSDDAAARRAA